MSPGGGGHRTNRLVSSLASPPRPSEADKSVARLRAERDSTSSSFSVVIAGEVWELQTSKNRLQ